MKKYSYEFKRKIVMEYLQGQGGYDSIAMKYNIPSSTPVRRWVASYNKYGDEGLKRRKQHQVFTFEFKIHVVELYLTSELSYQELALQVGVADASTITRWVMEYRAAGPEALKPKKKGRKRTMDKEKIIQEIEKGDSEQHKELLKQLQEENLRLRIENAFLKEARRLRLEEEALLREKRGSSTASEENSN